MFAALFLLAAAPAQAGPPAPAPAVQPDANAAFLAANAKQPGVVQTASGLQYQLLAAGAGAAPTDTDYTVINYAGTLLSGKQFDASTQPTPLPVAGVVPGFAEALKLMPRGAKLRVWIKPELGYGDRTMPGPDGTIAIPPHSILVFEIEMVDFVAIQTLRYFFPQPAEQPPAQ